MTNSGRGVDVRILDVGHGNTAVIRAGVTVVVDAAPPRTLLEDLERDPVDRIDHLVLSHADRDHIGGAIAAMSQDEVEVTTLWLNPDSEKDSELWGDLLAFAAMRRKEGRLRIVFSLNNGTSPIVSHDGLEIEVLHPDVELAGRGPVGRIFGAGKVSSNGASAVLRITSSGRAIALLAGDADQFALSRMLDSGIDLSADVLVFPHHGGNCAGDNYDFARKLATAVSPVSVIFSLSRTGLRNPLPDIVRGVRDGAPSARIACTQLSSRCSSLRTADLAHIAAGADHWLDLPAAGARASSRCAGSLRITSERGYVELLPTEEDHKEFINLVAVRPMCGSV